MAIVHYGTETTLAAFSYASLATGDVAYIFYNRASRKMVFTPLSTDANDLLDMPYVIRSADYSTLATGTWVHEIGDDVNAYSGDQIITGSLESTNFATNVGSSYNLDDEHIKLGGFNVTASGTAPGIFAGLDTNLYKLYAGDGVNQYFKYDGVNISWKGTSTSLSAAGVFTATDVILSGEITAVTGVVGGWTLATGNLHSTNIYLNSEDEKITINNQTFGNSGIQLDYNSGAPRAYIGDGNNQYFRYDSDGISWVGTNTSLSTAGVFTATDVHLTGEITSNSGAIGGWTLATGNLSSANITLDSINDKIIVDTITIDGAAASIESSNFVTRSAGFHIDKDAVEFGNVHIRGEMSAMVFKAETVQVVGGNFVVTAASPLAQDASSGQGYVIVEDGSQFTAGDTVKIAEGGFSDEFEILSISTNQLNFAGGDTLWNDWTAGVSAVKWDQRIFFTSELANSPYMSVVDSSNNEKARIGNLAGVAGCSGYGLWSENVFLTGKVIATSGTIGSWTIDSTSIYTGTKDFSGYTANAGDITIYSSGTNASIHAKNFYINSSGVLYATGAVISGAITISSGSGVTNLTDAGDLASQDTADWQTDVDGTGKPNDNADVTLTEVNGGLAVTGGGLTLTSGGASIKSGQTAYNTGTGFWLGLDGVTPKFSLGVTSGNKLLWNGSTLAITGSITITGGSGISNFTDAGILATANSLDDVPDGASYSRVATTAISAGKIVLTSSGVSGTLPTTLSAAKCTDASADQTSANTAADTSAVSGLAATSVAGWAMPGHTTYINGGDIYTNTITATQINVGTLSAISADIGSITAGSLNIGSGTFIVTSGGALTAASANISGAVTATSGKIGKWNINSTSLYVGTEDHSGYTANAGDITLYSDGSNSSIHSKYFYINTTGVLYATSANISGAITASSGSIGSFTIGTYLYTGSKTTYNSTNAGVHVGSDGIGLGTGQFKVSAAGVLTCTGASIQGAITAASGSFTGAIYASSGSFTSGSFYTCTVASSLAVNSTIVLGTNGAIYSGKTSYASTSAGFYLGGSSKQFHIGSGATNYLKWTGSALELSMTSGGINVYNGGDISIYSDYATGNTGQLIFVNEYTSGGSTYRFYIEPSGNANKILYFYPETTDVGTLCIGDPDSGIKKKMWEVIRGYAKTRCTFTSYYSSSQTAWIMAESQSSQSWANLNAYSSATNNSGVWALAGSTESVAIRIRGYNKFSFENAGVVVEDNYWIGFGSSAGRIVFDDQTIDRVDFMSCNVGIGGSSATDKLYVYENTDTSVIFARQGKNNGGSSTAFYFQDDRGYSGAISGTTFRVYSWRNATTDTSFLANFSTISGGSVYSRLSIVNTSGMVGINDSTPSFQLEVNGTCHVNGVFTATTKTFMIDHPVSPTEKILYHAVVEAPRHDLIYRGVAKLVNGTVEVDINKESNMSEGTFEALCQNFVVTQLQNQESFSRLRASVIGDAKFTILCEDNLSEEYVSWVVMAERADPAIKFADINDAEGHLIPEVIKETPTVEELKVLEPMTEKIKDTNMVGNGERRIDSLKQKKGYYLNPEAYGTKRPTRVVTSILKKKSKQ